MRRKYFFLVLLLMIPLCISAQGNIPLLQLPVIELLQYQVQKGKRVVGPLLFSKYGLQKIRTELIVDAADTRQLWGWHVIPNAEYNPIRQPLYRLLQRKTTAAWLSLMIEPGLYR